MREIRPYRSIEKKYETEEIQNILSTKFFGDCADMEKKGVEILQNNVKIYTECDFASAKGTLTVITDVGEWKTTEKLSLPEMTGEENI